MDSTSLFIAMAAVIVDAAIISLYFGRETRWLKQPDAIAAPVMGTVALLFGLFVTFGSSDAVQKGRELRLAVQREVSVARSILRFCESVGPTAAELREATIQYLQVATTRDRTWLSEGAKSEAPSQSAADDLVHLVTLFVGQAQVADPVKSLIVSKVDELRQARTARLSLLGSPSNVPQWIGLVLMATMTQAGIALSHIGRKKSAIIAVGSFTIVAVSAMFYLGWIEGLVGPSRVDQTLLPLEAIVRSL